MLYRLVRPVKRKGSSKQHFVQRIPADIKGRAAGLKLFVPVGPETVRLTISPKGGHRASEPGTVDLVRVLMNARAAGTEGPSGCHAVR